MSPRVCPFLPEVWERSTPSCAQRKGLPCFQLRKSARSPLICVIMTILLQRRSWCFLTFASSFPLHAAISDADLIQEGNIGLMKEIRRYDPDRGARLMTFAQHWIRSEIQEYIIRNWRIVKLATTKNQRKLFFNLRQLKEDSQAALTHNEAERIALTLDVKPKEVLDMEERMYGQEASLDAPSDADSDENYSPSDWLTRKSDEPEAMLEEEDKQRLEGEGLQKALASLDPRSRRVIEARYLNVDAEGNAKPVTLQALAKEFNISAERVRQIEKLAIKKMHGELAGEDPF